MLSNRDENNKATHLIPNSDTQLIARQRAEEVGMKAGEALASLVTELLLAILADKSASLANIGFQSNSSACVKSSIESNALYTAGEVAQVLKISKSEAYRLIQQREIQGIRFGRTTRVRGADLESFIANHRK
jgi:excisionase family DNA binding protein